MFFFLFVLVVECCEGFYCFFWFWVGWYFFFVEFVDGFFGFYIVDDGNYEWFFFVVFVVFVDDYVS